MSRLKCLLLGPYYRSLVLWIPSHGWGRRGAENRWGNGICPEITVQCHGQGKTPPTWRNKSKKGYRIPGCSFRVCCIRFFLQKDKLAGTFYNLPGGSSTHSVGVPGSFYPQLPQSELHLWIKRFLLQPKFYWPLLTLNLEPSQGFRTLDYLRS